VTKVDLNRQRSWWRSPGPIAGKKRLHRAPRADELPTWSAPNRLPVGQHSVLSVRLISLLVSYLKAKLLLHSRARLGEVA